MAVTEVNIVTDLLNQLGLSQVEVARQLGVSDRTVRRWVQDPASAPGPALTHLRRLALERILRRRSLPVDNAYFEGSSQFGDLTSADLQRELEWAIELDRALSRVEARRGPAHRWRVELRENGAMATLGDRSVTFYRNRSGAFSVQTSRNVETLDLFDEAASCVAQALRGHGWPLPQSSPQSPLGDWLVSLSRAGDDLDDKLQHIRKRSARAATFEN